MLVKCTWNLKSNTHSLHIQSMPKPEPWHQVKVTAKKQQGPVDLLVCQARFRRLQEAITARLWNSAQNKPTQPDQDYDGLISINLPSPRQEARLTDCNRKEFVTINKPARSKCQSKCSNTVVSHYSKFPPTSMRCRWHCMTSCCFFLCSCFSGSRCTRWSLSKDCCSSNVEHGSPSPNVFWHTMVLDHNQEACLGDTNS